MYRTFHFLCILKSIFFLFQINLSEDFSEQKFDQAKPDTPAHSGLIIETPQYFLFLIYYPLIRQINVLSWLKYLVVTENGSQIFYPIFFHGELSIPSSGKSLKKIPPLYYKEVQP